MYHTCITDSLRNKFNQLLWTSKLWESKEHSSCNWSSSCLSAPTALLRRCSMSTAVSVSGAAQGQWQLASIKLKKKQNPTHRLANNQPRSSLQKQTSLFHLLCIPNISGQEETQSWKHSAGLIFQRRTSPPAPTALVLPAQFCTAALSLPIHGVPRTLKQPTSKTSDLDGRPQLMKKIRYSLTSFIWRCRENGHRCQLWSLQMFKCWLWGHPSQTGLTI